MSETTTQQTTGDRIAAEDRYFVDERGGCVAVRDRALTDPEYRGLHWYTEGVVRYWHGKFVDGGWTVNPADVAEAHAACAELNAATGPVGDIIRDLAYADYEVEKAEQRADMIRHRLATAKASALLDAALAPVSK